MDFCKKKKTKPDPNGKKIGILLYPCFDSLDVIGAHQVFHYATKFEGGEVFLIGPGVEDLQAPELECFIKDSEKRLVKSGEGVLLEMNISYEEYLKDESGYCALDLIYVPGAMQTNTPLYMADTMEENNFFKVIEKARKEAGIIASVCTGALLLGVAGLLKGRKVTTHWEVANLLRQFPGVTVEAGYPRYVVDENIITGGGISSTIDEALAITTILFDKKTAEKTQLVMQYNPDPPVDSGDPSRASPGVMYNLTKQKTPYQPGFGEMGDDFLKYIKNKSIR